MYSQIYLVDDEEVVNFIHRTMLSELGVENKVIGFTNPEKALDHVRFRESKTEPILILLDINMPEMTGFEFLEFMVLEDFPDNIDVAIVTSSVSDADKEQAKEYPQFVKGFVSKPVKASQLRKLLGISASLQS